MAHSKTPPALSRWYMELPSIGGDNTGGGAIGDAGIYWEAT